MILQLRRRLSHETRFACQNLRAFCEFGWSGGNPSSKADFFFRFYILGGNPFARNKVGVSKTESFLRFYIFGGNPSHETRFECQNLGFCDFTSSAATLLRETRFERERKPEGFLRFYILGGNPFAWNKVRVSKTESFLRFYIFGGNSFARNEVRVSKTEGFLLRFDNFRGNSFERNEVAVTLSPCV